MPPKRAAAARVPEPKRRPSAHNDTFSGAFTCLRLGLASIDCAKDELQTSAWFNCTGDGCYKEIFDRTLVELASSAPDRVGEVERPAESFDAMMKRAEQRLRAMIDISEEVIQDASVRQWFRYLKALATAEEEK